MVRYWGGGAGKMNDRVTEGVSNFYQLLSADFVKLGEPARGTVSNYGSHK